MSPKSKSRGPRKRDDWENLRRGGRALSPDAAQFAALLPFPLPEPMDETEFRSWFKGDFLSWVQVLHRHFYDFTEGFVGPEGDPCRLAGPVAPCALAESSKTSTCPVPAGGGVPEAERVAQVSVMLTQLSLPFQPVVSYTDHDCLAVQAG